MAVTGGIAGAASIGGYVAARSKKEQISQNSIPEASQQEKDLQKAAIEQYLQQRQLIDQQQEGLGALDPLRQQSLEGLQGIASGQAFNATPQEIAQIQAIREAQITQGSFDVNRLLGQNLTRTQGLAGVRGLRGQALGEMQGQNLRLAGDQIGSIVNQAGTQAAQNALENPYRRVAAQTPVMQMGLTYQDQLRQQAIQNRQMAANPALLEYFQRSRMANSRNVNTIPGGNFVQGIGGAMSGAAGGANMGSSIMGAYGGGGGGGGYGGMNMQVASAQQVQAPAFGSSYNPGAYQYHL